MIKQRGASHDLGTLPSTKYASMNFNRFEYLYNFRNEQKENNLEKSFETKANIENSLETVQEKHIEKIW